MLSYKRGGHFLRKELVNVNTLHLTMEASNPMQRHFIPNKKIFSAISVSMLHLRTADFKPISNMSIIKRKDFNALNVIM